MIERIDHVTAHFGGRDLTFKLDRERIPYIEEYLGEALQVRWRKIMSGDARQIEVMQIVELAAPAGLGVKQPASDIDVFRLKLTMLRKPTWVAKVFAENPPARYAVLAQGIIAACLTGIPPDAAHFDERATDDDEDITDV